VLKSKAPDLLSLLFLLLMLLMVSSTLMYHLEHEAQPNAFSSIPATMWWGIVTLTTIGYGDMAPVTAGGRALGGVIAILGIGMFALPAGLLGAAFVDELGKARAARAPAPTAGEAPHHCPHCGKQLN
jgi:voltage-gated potassium channel